jgi:hypothetical protein
MTTDRTDRNHLLRVNFSRSRPARLRTKTVAEARVFTEEKSEILLLINRHQMTVENIAIALEITEENAAVLVESLVIGGYISDTKINILQRRNRKMPTAPLNKKSFFKLTNKGFFKVHPVISSKP